MLRQATLDDSAAAVALLGVVNRELVLTVAGYRQAWATSLPESRRAAWCIELEGGCVGWATCSLMTETTTPGVGWIGASVHPDQRGKGLGAMLLRAAERHAAEIGVQRLLAWSHADEAATAFARNHGYEQTASNEILVVDPRDVGAPTPPVGVELLPFAAFEADPRPIFDVDVVSMRDMPGEAQLDALSYERWLDSFWRNPVLDRDASVVARVGGEAVALTILNTDRTSGRGWNNGTGTRPEHRGRGLATLVKSASLVRAAQYGCTAVYTGNDATNAPMLAVNRKLGYRFCRLELSLGKTLAPTSEP